MRSSHTRLPLTLLLWALFAAMLPAQRSELVVDTNPTPVPHSSYPNAEWHFVVIPGALHKSNFPAIRGLRVFAATTRTTGRELYITGGTRSTTQLLKDIHAGPGSSKPRFFAETSRGIFFTANDGKHGEELWITDGTAQGTRMVVDLEPGPGHASLGQLVPLGNSRVAFSAHRPATGFELWSSDGTAAGTRLVKDIAPGTGSSSPLSLCPDETGKRVYFQATTAASGSEPWVTDGTQAGTYQVAEIAPGAQGSTPGKWLAFSHARMLFVADDGTHGFELWITDGTANGTQMVVDLHPGAPSSAYYMRAARSGPLALCVLGEPVHGVDLWITDGTRSGTLSLSSLTKAVALGGPKIRPCKGGWLVLCYGGDLLFTDGSISGTRLLAPHVAEFAWDPGSTQCYFRTTNDTLRRTDLSGANSSILGRIRKLHMLSACASSRVVFVNDDERHGSELWGSDGTPEGTGLLADIDPERGETEDGLFLGMPGSEPVALHGQMLFCSGPKTGTRYLWRAAADGDAIRLRDEARSWLPSSFSHLTKWRNELLMKSDDAFASAAVFRSDGTGQGTHPLMSDDPFTHTAPTFRDFAVAGDRLFLSAGTLQGDRLFLIPTRSDTPALIHGFGTQSYYDLSRTATVGSRLFFAAETQGYGRELWVSDGTSLGTKLVKDIEPGPRGADFYEPVVLGSHVYFRASTSAHGSELWRSDGTAQGTQLVHDCSPGASDGNPSHLTVVGSRLFFVAQDPVHGQELWISSGTSSTTKRLTDLDPGLGSGAHGPLIEMGGKLFFAGVSPGTGAEIAVSDGTTRGSFILEDIDRGTGCGGFEHPLRIGARHIYFVASDGILGRELWRTDGTARGTVLAEDIHPGPDGSDPIALTLAGGNLYFQATHPIYGAELLRMKLPIAHAQKTGPSCSGAWLSAGDPVLGTNTTAARERPHDRAVDPPLLR